jgi:hypothetical protein
VTLIGAGALLATLGSPGWIEIVEPTPPTSVAVGLRADCAAQSVALDYRLNRPGPDIVTAVAIGGRALPDGEVSRINEMIAGYMLDSISVVSCTGVGAEYEVTVRLVFGRGPDRLSRILGIRNGRLRTIA